MTISRIAEAYWHSEGPGGGTLSNAFNAGTGSNRGLVVATHYEQDTSQNNSAVSYNGVALTNEISQPASVANAFHEDTKFWFLAEPASGSNTLAADFDVTTGTNDITIQAFVLQGSVGALSAGASNSAAFPDTDTDEVTEVAITTTVANSMIICTCTAEAGKWAPWTPATGVTEIHDDAFPDAVTGAGIAWFAGQRLTTTTGSYTVGATADVQTGGADRVVVALEITEAATLTADKGTFTLTGQAAAFKAERKLVAATGTFTISGQAADLIYTPAAVDVLDTHDGARRKTRIVDTRRRDRADEQGRLERDAQEAERRAIIERTFREIVEGLPPELAADEELVAGLVAEELAGEQPVLQAREIAALIMEAQQRRAAELEQRNNDALAFLLLVA